jgi:hypothetical protein
MIAIDAVLSEKDTALAFKSKASSSAPELHHLIEPPPKLQQVELQLWKQSPQLAFHFSKEANDQVAASANLTK